MRLNSLCIIMLCILSQVRPTYSAATLSAEWRLDYATGDGVLIDSANKALERNPLQKISNLRIFDDNPNFVLGDIHYTRKNGTPLTLTFQSKLETNRTSHQDDSTLQLRVLIYRYCFFVDKAYHLPPEIISTTPYTPLPENTTYSDIIINEPSLRVMFMYGARYRRPFDSSDYVCSHQLTVPIKRTLLRFTYMDEQRECYPTHHLTAHHEGYELLNKEVTSTHPIMYTPLKTGQLDLSSIERIAPDRVSVSLTEEWLRPNTDAPIQLSRRLELPVRIETTYKHDDANLSSTKLLRSYVRHQSKTIILSETSEIISYEDVVTHDLTKNLNYKRPDGSFYRKKPIPPKDDDEFVLL